MKHRQGRLRHFGASAEGGMQALRLAVLQSAHPELVEGRCISHVLDEITVAPAIGGSTGPIN